PAGFLGEKAAPLRLRLRPGDRLALLSDGVTSGEEDAWLRALLSGEAEGQALADLILEEAVRRTGAADDMTVLIVEVSAW
ncbi:MAG: SpoIIE family protein phosphatase, partial [bacterium]